MYYFTQDMIYSQDYVYDDLPGENTICIYPK